MRDEDEILLRGSIDLIIFGQTAGIAQPRKSSFHSPALRQDFKLGLNLLGNIDPDLEDWFDKPFERATVTLIRADSLDGWIFLLCPCEHITSAFCIVNIGGMDMHCKNVAHDICHDMPLAPFRFFPPSYPRFSASAVVLTL